MPEPRMFRILVVEDSHSERLFISSVIKAIQFEGATMDVMDCNDGQKALDLCQHQTFDLILSDWRMPNLSGIELCIAVKKHASPPYILLLTGNSQDEDLIFAMSSGADDYLAKPFAPKVLQIRVVAALRLVSAQHVMHAQQQELTQALALNQAQLNDKQTELQQAALLQQALLPDAEFSQNHWQANHCFIAASELAGDMMQCFAIDNDTIGFFLVDITGHGAGPAMLSFTLTQLLNPNQVDWQLTPAELMCHLNQHFIDPCDQGTFATVLIGKFNTLSGELILSNAGHPRPVIMGPQNASEINMPSHLPVGISKDTQYTNWQSILQPNDRLMIYSDGAYEGHHDTHGMFGMQRLLNICKNTVSLGPSALLAHLQHCLSLWQQGQQQDDISVLLLSHDAIEK
ncbi:SpoIIE family protein phosphatase [Shewanella intestini]|uniref:Fused response regulator/phosphatase n=1 Tax=Shewanella intestini TaxID=2017544 RepID=A0ABS5HYG4_9GAMM|nr:MULTISPECIES: fused response regulator/phosphatase [Shewanella]MBR9726825.1 fused response regulator/phosphatase [Shewanella intestini]MRG34609.1 SpoIIE family protein phosphatase [Shewanella sp. XMDDZSB0408]